MAAIDTTPGWDATLDLGFVRRGKDTILAHNRHEGPLRLQRPLHPEPEVCHGLILHPPGGVVGGDRLAINTVVGPGASALLTTPGATKFYRSDRRRATQDSRLIVSAEGRLEWFPQETIVYSGAHAVIETRVDLSADAGFMGWEILCLGLPACGSPFENGALSAGLTVTRDSRPILRDRLVIDGSKDLYRPAGLRGLPVSGTFVATGVDTAMLVPLRELVEKTSTTPCGLTLVEDLLVTRSIGNCSADARQLFQQLWTWLRPRVFGRNACIPRIWET